MKLIICRHGQTDFNVQRRLQGHLETELNENGLNQAKLVSEYLKDLEFDYAFSSPQKRCKATANEIMKHHKDKELVFRDELKEIDVGIYMGMTAEEIDEQFPNKWSERVNNKYDFKHKDGESYKGVDENRVQPLLKEFREKYSSRTILIVTHQGTGKLIIGNLFGLNGDEKMNIMIPNDCVYTIDYLPHKTVSNYIRIETGEEGEGWIKRNE